MKILLIAVEDNAELEEREGWSDDLRREYDEAEVALGIVPGLSPVILKGGRVGEFSVLVAAEVEGVWKLAHGSYDVSEAVAEGRKL